MDLDEIEARANALPEGNWYHGPLGPRVVCSGDYGTTGPDYPEPPFFEPVCEIGGDDASGVPNPNAVAACAFIAASREDVPALCARVRELEAALAGIDDALDWHTVGEGARAMKAKIRGIVEEARR